MARLNKRRIVKDLGTALAALAVIVLMVAMVSKPDQSVNTQEANKKPSAASREKTKKAPTVPLYTFPKGGRELFPQYRLAALYGTPSSARLGALGEQSLPESIARAKDIAAQLQPFTDEHVWPAFEIIATVASATPTPDGNYSRELGISELRPWVDAAKKAGIYVVLDLQPGRTDFLTQAKQYEPLLKEPHVGLALDPEWRLAPEQVHLEQIGSVTAAEVNTVSSWVAELVKQNKLPQKLFLLHQFRLSMLTNREHLDTSRKELAYVIQMDGNGDQPAKLGTWGSIRAEPPPNVLFGWKNFYTRDHPMLSPQATMQLDPQPWFVSYQ